MRVADRRRSASRRVSRRPRVIPPGRARQDGLAVRRRLRIRRAALRRRYGDLVGTAFQMADDMVDFSPSSGKPVGLDVRQKVLSLPLIYAAEDRVVGPEVRRLLAGALGDKEVARVSDLVTSSNALPRVREEAQALVEEAARELESVELDGLRPTLVGLARSAVDRQS